MTGCAHVPSLLPPTPVQPLTSSQYNVQFYNRKSSYSYEHTNHVPLTSYRHAYAESPSPGYENCDTLFRSAGGSSVFEICASGIPADKIVVSKPGSALDTTNGGFMEPAMLGICVAQAVQGGWNAGVMAYQVSAVWAESSQNIFTPLSWPPTQYPHANTSWLAAVKGKSFSE